MRTIRAQARRAGLFYFVMSVIAPYGLLVAPGKLYVAGDPAATAQHVAQFGDALRLGIASELSHQALGIFLALALYRLFKAVNDGLAKQLLVLSLLGVPIMFLNSLNWVAAAMLAKGAPFLGAFSQAQLDALVYLFVRLHDRGVNIASVYWGLWLFPFALLVIRSGFIPRALGYLMILAGISYMATSTAVLVLPSIGPFVFKYSFLFEVCEVPIIFWLLIWGAKGPRANDPVAIA